MEWDTMAKGLNGLAHYEAELYLDTSASMRLRPGELTPKGVESLTRKVRQAKAQFLYWLTLQQINRYYCLTDQAGKTRSEKAWMARIDRMEEALLAQDSTAMERLCRETLYEAMPDVWGKR